MKNPCIKCITLAACKARSRNKPMVFLLWTVNNCQLYHDYIINDVEDVNIDRANEIGKLFNYQIGKTFNEG